MAHHARIEELSDSDPDEMDPSDFDPTPLTGNTIMRPVDIPYQAPAAPSQAPAQAPPRDTLAQDKERTKHWQCLYPVYFDSQKSYAQGRRIAKKLAVANPLARELAEAVSSLGINVVLEPGKTHPKDWANPGRVRVLVKKEGQSVATGVKNKHHLYIRVAEYLQAHPTTADSPLRLRIPGMPPTTKPPPPPAVPRGWKMGTILPFHSAAVSGGGVSENLFKDMMNQMQGQEPEAAPAAVKPKKEKKKLKA